MQASTIISKLPPILTLTLSTFLLAGLSACQQSLDYKEGQNKQGHTAPSNATIRANKKILDERPFTNREDFDPGHSRSYRSRRTNKYSASKR